MSDGCLRMGGFLGWAIRPTVSTSSFRSGALGRVGAMFWGRAVRPPMRAGGRRRLQVEVADRGDLRAKFGVRTVEPLLRLVRLHLEAGQDPLHAAPADVWHDAATNHLVHQLLDGARRLAILRCFVRSNDQLTRPRDDLETLHGVNFGAWPGRGRSSSPASPSRRKRRRQRSTVVGWTPTRRATSSAVCWPSSHAKMILARRAARCSDVAARTLRWSSARTPSAIVTVIGGRPRRATLPQDHRVDRRATPLRPNARSPRSLPVNNGRQAIDLPPVSASRGAFDFRPSFPAGSADRTTSQACRIRPG